MEIDEGGRAGHIVCRDVYEHRCEYSTLKLISCDDRKSVIEALMGFWLVNVYDLQ